MILNSICYNPKINVYFHQALESFTLYFIRLPPAEDHKPVPTQTLSGVTTAESTDDAVLPDPDDEVQEEIKKSKLFMIKSISHLHL